MRLWLLLERELRELRELRDRERERLRLRLLVRLPSRDRSLDDSRGGDLRLSRCWAGRAARPVASTTCTTEGRVPLPLGGCLDPPFFR